MNGGLLGLYSSHLNLTGEEGGTIYYIILYITFTHSAMNFFSVNNCVTTIELAARLFIAMAFR